MQFIGLLGSIPQIIVVVATLMYVTKRSTPEGMLMAIGAVIGLLVSLFYTVALPWLSGRYGMDWYQSKVIFISGIGIIGGLSFSIGLLMLVQDVLKDRR